MIRVSDIPSRVVIPDGLYLCKVAGVRRLEEEPIRTYLVSLNVLEPTEYRGARVFDRLVIGTERDPEVKDPQTLKTSQGLHKLRKLIVKSGCGVEEIDDHDEFMGTLTGSLVVARIALYQNQGVIDPSRKGQFGNLVRDYFAQDEREPYANEECWSRFSTEETD